MGVKLKSLTLREKHRLRLYWNRVLRRIFGTEKEEIIGFRKLHNEVQNWYNFLCSDLLKPNITTCPQFIYFSSLFQSDSCPVNLS